GTPALVHGGPFANIAHGCNSLAATRLAQSLSEITVTEAGFGSDLGAEKFLDIKARLGGLSPDAAVVVATVRALKLHGGVAKADLEDEDVEAALAGTTNLARHVDNLRKFGIEPVIALNRFPTDTEAELEAVLEWARANGFKAALSEVWAKGGEGGLAVAEQVLAALDEGADFRHLYDPAGGVEESLRTLAREVYGADDVVLEGRAPAQLRMLRRNGWDSLPVCVAKTQYSLSDDPALLGAPTGHVLHVRDLVPKIGAGFVVALTGTIMTMPGLPKQPAALHMGVTAEGESHGVFRRDGARCARFLGRVRHRLPLRGEVRPGPVQPWRSGPGIALGDLLRLPLGLILEVHVQAVDIDPRGAHGLGLVPVAVGHGPGGGLG